MRRGSTAQFMKTGEGYNGRGDFNELKRYLIPISDSVLSQDPHIWGQIQHHLDKANQVLKKELPNVVNNIQELVNQSDHNCVDDFVLPPSNPVIRKSLTKLRFLIDQITELNRITLNERIIVLQEQRELMESMIELTQFLLDTHKAVSIRIQRIVNPRDRTVYLCNQKNQVLLSALRRAANREYIIVQLAPPPFRSNTHNKSFLDYIIDNAQRKPETTYFSELKAENDLCVLLQMPEKSPLIKEGIWPYEYETNPESVKDWIDQATVAVAEYDLTEDEDRASTIAMLCERFLFVATYPLLYPPISPTHDSLLRKMEKFKNRTPRDIGILLKYVPPELVDEPAYKIFEYDDMAKEPVTWMREAEFQTTPIDAAWCVVKAHECLSIMCVKREMTNKGKTSYTSEEYAEKMPGFDDIFEMWRAFLSSCDLGDPRQLLNFINDYSRLPGFTARILASIAYLEASVGQLEEEPE